MPSPDHALKGSGGKAQDKKTDLGAKLSKRRSQDFASKIQGWNDNGGGVAPKQDKPSVSAHSKDPGTTPSKTDDNAQKSTPKTKSPPNADHTRDGAPAGDSNTPGAAQAEVKTPAAKKPEVVLSRQGWVRRKSKAQVDAKPPVDLTLEVKHAGTPKKRVVSDGHWRRDRQAKEETAQEEKPKEVVPNPIIIRRSVVSVGLKIPPSTQEFVDFEPALSRTRPLRPFRTRSQSVSDGENDPPPDFQSTGTKVYIKRRRRSKTFDNLPRPAKDSITPESSFTSPSDPDRSVSAADRATPLTPVTIDVSRKPSPESRPASRDPRSGRSSIAPKTTPPAPDLEPQRPNSSRRRTKTPVQDDEDRPRNLRTSKSYTNAMPSKNPVSTPATPVTPRIYGNRIEGWLADTTDPFLEKQDPKLTPQPLNIPKRKSRRELDAADTANQSSDDGTKRQRSRTSPGLRDALDRFVEDLAGPNYTPSRTVSPGLKRAGAQRASQSPIKLRDSTASPPLRDQYTDLDPGDNPTSHAKLQKRSSPNLAKRSSDLTNPLTRTQTFTTTSDPSDHATLIPDDVSAVSDSEMPATGIKRRLTKHSDLMSVLSQSRDDRHTIISSHSSRRRQLKPEYTSIAVIMNELSIQELQYQRELRILVDGVIPVLLQHALSDTKSGTAKRVFSGAANDPATTKPVVDMGVSLERLKTMHRRIPMHEPTQLINWAETATKIYEGYFQAWRLGFKDVVVNLAPAQPGSAVEREDHTPPHNKEGYLIDGEGGKVDVAFLLKRPLVRVKHLAKTLKAINQLEPSPGAGKLAVIYQGLVANAKQRVVEENARLEDEAAASIDATRARDPRSLGPIIGVTIDPARCVRARDYFDMELYHSSGQQVCCKIELIYRDDAANRGSSGDVLFCEVSSTGRWLLFPPLPVALVTARKSDRSGELVVMIRGFLSDARQWRELMFLQPDEEQASTDWLEMLGSSPLPPRIVRKSTFDAIQAQAARGQGELGVPAPSQPVKSREPSPREIEIPIGERAQFSSRVWDGSELSSVADTRTRPHPQQSSVASYSTFSSAPTSPSTHRQGYFNGSEEPEYYYDRQEPRRSRDQPARRPVTSYTRTESDWTVSTASTYSGKDYSVWMPSSEKLSDEDSPDEYDLPSERPIGQRPSMRRRTSSVPSLDMPSIPKLRKTSDEMTTPKKSVSNSAAGPNPGSAPAKLQKRRSSVTRPGESAAQAPASQPATRTATTPIKALNLAAKPTLTPTFLKKNRRPSSPLKHEYEPSTDSDSLSDSDLSDSDDLESVTSKSSATPEEGVSTVGTLKAFHNYTRRPYNPPPPAVVESPSLPSNTSDSPRPSDSASQAPYRSVPSTGATPAKLTASIFTWSDSGAWISLHPEECSVFVTPGLIEAFDMTQAQSVNLSSEDGRELTPSSRGIKPLVALELTPLVPLRRGTAVDISVRSPANDRSLIRTGNNIMFRSHSQEECDRLYALINRARIDNPTYIALQNARGPQQSNWGEIMDHRNAQRTTSSGSSWWQFGSRKGSTYRSSGSRPASVAATESSVGTMTSTFSALRRFSSGSRFFNIAKSTILSKDGTRSSSNSESLSSGVGSALPRSFDPRLGTPLGIPDTKIRLYLREDMSKWRDMGAARMTIMLPPGQDLAAAATAAVDTSPHAAGLQKRILIYGKSKGELLLDQTLGESCFERVARTGIAVSVWEDAIGPIGRVAAIGGVTPSRSKVYMIQLRTEREAAYTFGLVGKLRY